MAEYLHPGVYIEEQPAPQSIQGVSTSTAGFVGVTKRGDTTGTTFVTSFADFKRKLGGHFEAWPSGSGSREMGSRPLLSYAVQAFFDNGGSRLYVSRVLADDAAASSLKLLDGSATRLSKDTAQAAGDRDEVYLADLTGIDEGVTLSFSQQLEGTQQSETAGVERYDTQTGRVELDAQLSNRFTADGCIVRVDTADSTDPAAGSAGAPTLKISAKSEGDWGDALSVWAGRSDSPVLLSEGWTRKAVEVQPTEVTITQGPAANKKTIDLGGASLSEGDTIRIGSGPAAEEFEIVDTSSSPAELDHAAGQDFSSVTTVERLNVVRASDPSATVTLPSGHGVTSGQVVRFLGDEGQLTAEVSSVTGQDVTIGTNADFPAFDTVFAGATLVHGRAGQDQGTTVKLRSAGPVYVGAILELDDGLNKEYRRVTAINGNEVELDSKLPRDFPSDAPVRLVEVALRIEGPNQSESYDRLSLDNTTDRFIEDAVNNASGLVQVELLAFDTGGSLAHVLPRTRSGAPASLEGGKLGSVPDWEDVVGEDNGPGKRSGIQALVDEKDVSIMAAPGISHSAVRSELLTQCARLKDRFAVLDPMPDSTMATDRPDDIIVQRSQHDSLYGAMYYPWLRRMDPANPDNDDGMVAPPSGYVVGCYARTDNDRGVHKAPANVTLRGVIGVEKKLNDRDQDILNPKNINVIRDMRANQRGIRIWGARCITSNQAWKYVPVRRLFIFIEESLDQGLQWVVFEPNGTELWARVRRTVSNFLRTLWSDGALAGRTPEQAFFVRCDERTMSETDRKQGRLIVEIGVAPLHPAEFVIIRIGQKTLDAQG